MVFYIKEFEPEQLEVRLAFACTCNHEPETRDDPSSHDFSIDTIEEYAARYGTTPTGKPRYRNLTHVEMDLVDVWFDNIGIDEFREIEAMAWKAYRDNLKEISE